MCQWNKAARACHAVVLRYGDHDIRHNILLTQNRAQRIGEALEDLYGTVFKNLTGPQNDSDVATIFDRAAATVCVGCKKKEECWQRDFMDTLSIMNDATPMMMKRGRLVKDDLAERFTERCAQHYAFINAVNAELRSLMYRRQFRSRLNENRIAAYGQYKELADIIGGVSKELSNAQGADPLAERRLKRFLRAMDIEADVSVFRDSRGRLHVVIESGRLGPLLRQGNNLEILSGVVGKRLCLPPTDIGVSDRRLVLFEAEPLVANVGLAGMKKKGEPTRGAADEASPSVRPRSVRPMPWPTRGRRCARCRPLSTRPRSPW